MKDTELAIRVSDVSKRFVIRTDKSLKERLVNFRRSNRHKEDFFALNHVSLGIKRGTTVGIIGPNGSGKSTLLKTIAGILQPTTGTVQHRGRVVALLELGAGFHPDLTGRENVYLNAAILGIPKSTTDECFEDIVEFSGVGQFIDTQVKFYSSGMYVRLAFAVAVNVDPDILIVDEVLAVGDEPFQRKCLDRIRELQQRGKTIVLVTHALDQLAEFCSRVVVLESGRVVFDGEPGPAIQRLRRDFEAIRQDAIAEDDAADTGPARAGASITSVTVKTPRGHVLTNAIRPGDGLSVEVSIAVPSRTVGWIVGVGIESSAGQVIFGTNSKSLHTPTTPIRHGLTYRFDLPRLPLARGQYFVYASFSTARGGELARAPQATSFFVDDSSTDAGLLRVQVNGDIAQSA